MTAERYIGLMSGTSVDSVDAVLAEFTAAPRVIARRAHPLPQTLRRQLLAMNTPGANELDRAARLDNAVARCFAAAVNALLEQAGVRAESITAIGSHGQTVRHSPTASAVAPDPGPYTVQLGNPSLICELTGITTVADFRRRDIAAGGQGAPLAPAFHAAFFAPAGHDQVVVNIGGIANLTLLPAASASAAAPPVIGFDTGPGNALLDEWIERCQGAPFDRDGVWAASGETRSALLERWLAEPYFALPPPKSTGRDLLRLDWLGDLSNQRPQDVQASLAALTAATVADAVRRYAPAAGRVWVCGGGVHNRALMRELTDRLAPLPVASSAAAGVDPDDLEALGFAWLARQTLAGLPGNLPAVTGAAGPRVLGGVYPR